MWCFYVLFVVYVEPLLPEVPILEEEEEEDPFPRGRRYFQRRNAIAGAEMEAEVLAFRRRRAQWLDDDDEDQPTDDA